ncbi:MAG TPA: YicC family protein [Candidatus Kapabacteria bacterium]|nr:YicC family protein [Candidatus Kapabacteria bacterium]
MLKSMTGFAKAEFAKDYIKATCELKCVNGKFLDLNIKLPRNLQSLEIQLRDMLKNRISRGTVTLMVQVEYIDPTKALVFNEEKAKAVYEHLNSLKNSLKIKDPIHLEHLINFDEFFIEVNNQEDEKLISQVVKQATNQALMNLEKMQLIEGKNLEKDIFRRLQSFQTNLDKIRALSLEKVPQEREKYRQKIAQLFESDEIDEQRLYLEIVILADKLDITEECTRLDSHISFFNEALKSKISEGRKINFLIQEMNREINTIGSKANDAEISQLVVLEKEELERIREQIQNVE